MKIKPLTAALVAAGLLAVGTASAVDLTPNWLKPKSVAVAEGESYKAASDAGAPPAVPMLWATA